MLNIDPILLLMQFVVMIGSLSIHEAAHAWSANRLGDSTARRLGRLTINPVAHVDVFGTIVLPLIAIFSNFPIIGYAKPVPVDTRNLGPDSGDGPGGHAAPRLTALVRPTHSGLPGQPSMSRLAWPFSLA